MEVIAYEMQQKVKIRKFDVDCDSLCKCLRKHKEKYGFTNLQISQILNVSLTKVQHWFRNDKCFSIPDSYIWFNLKKLLQIKTDEFDKSIMTFQEKENVFEKSNRIYDSCGISPTITCSDSVVFLDRSNYMEVIKLFDIPKEIINDNERQRRVYSSDGISPTILGRSDNAKIMEVERIANLFGSDKGTGFAGNIWDKSKLSPTITTMQGGIVSQ